MLGATSRVLTTEQGVEPTICQGPKQDFPRHRCLPRGGIFGEGRLHG